MLCALLFPLVMFSAKLTHSYFLGMSGAIWLTADLFVIAERRGACPCRRQLKAQPGCSSRCSPACLACSPTAPPSTCSSCSCSSAWRSCCGPNFPVQARGPCSLGTLAAALLVLGLGLAFRNAPQAKPDFAFDLPKLVEFVLIYLGNALATGPLRLVAGLVILARASRRSGVSPPSGASRRRCFGSFSSSSLPSTR